MKWKLCVRTLQSLLSEFSFSEFPVSSIIYIISSIERNSTMPLPAFFVGRWVLAEQPETLMRWFAFVSLLQWKLNWTPRNFLWFLLELAKHHTSLVTPTTHVHSDLSTTFHVATQQRGKQHHAVTSLVCRSLGACWTARNSDAVVCCYRPFLRGTCAERHETSLGFMLEQATQRHRHLSTMSHVTTQHRGKQHTRLRTIFWFAKSRPSCLLCVKSLESKGTELAGGSGSYFPSQSQQRPWKLGRENVPAS